MSKPPTVVDLAWIDRLRFTARLPNAELTIDSSGAEGPSPVQTLGVALASCISVDVVHIQTRGRHPLTALRTHLHADRSPSEPHRFVRVELHLEVEGDIPADAVQRAIDLSREKYCSVWHSLRQDIELQVTFDLAPGKS